MKLHRPAPQRQLISLVSMIDVLMIMLVFFMVTSTYLDLDMIRLVDRQDEAVAAPAAPGSGAAAATVLVRLPAGGGLAVSGRAVTPPELTAYLSERIGAEAAPRVVILPSGGATTQALVDAIAATRASGATGARILRLEDTR